MSRVTLGDAARGRSFRAVAASCFLVCSACGLNMAKHYGNYRSDLLSGDFVAADEYIESQKKGFYGEKNRLLYYMDKGMVLHLAKRYEESNQFLEKAKTAAQELWTDSVGENALAWITTDNSISYQGEDFEKVLIHFIAAENYLALGDYSAARVEARQISDKLELYNSRYPEGNKNVYRDDAFARWLSGKLAETEGGFAALNDAWIDYKRALEIYETDYAARYRTRVPQQVVADALRVLDGLGEDFSAELERLKTKYPGVQYLPHQQAEEMSEVVLIHSAGEAPYKIDKFWTAHANGDVLRIAFPKFVARSYRVKGARLSAVGSSATTEKAQDITAIALRNLDDKMGRIKAKAIARAVTKFTAGKVAQVVGKKTKNKAAGGALQLAGAVWNLSQAIAEEADKRSWVSLPGVISIASIFVLPGKLNVAIDFLGGGSIGVTVEAKAGKTTFLTYRTFR